MRQNQLSVPEDLLYDKENYWVKVTGNEALIGLTEYGQSTIGDIIYLDHPPVGTLLRRGEGFGSLESGKWVGKLVPPVTGIVIGTNTAVYKNPGKVNSDPYKEGWIIKVRLESITELDSLMDAETYSQWVHEQEVMEMEDDDLL